MVLLGAGRPRDALDLLEGALAGRSRLLDPSDRDVISTLSNLALCADECGDRERSLALLREALQRVESLAEPPLFTHVGLLNNIGSLLHTYGRTAEALPYLERGVAVAAQGLGPDNPAPLALAANMAAIVRASGDPERSASILLDVVERREQILGPAAEDTLTARHGYWTSIGHCGRHEDALSGFEELSADVGRALGAEHQLWAQTEISLAHCMIQAGRPADALPHAREAEARMEARYGHDHDRTRGARAIVERARAGAGE